MSIMTKLETLTEKLILLADLAIEEKKRAAGKPWQPELPMAGPAILTEQTGKADAAAAFAAPNIAQPIPGVGQNVLAQTAPAEEPKKVRKPRTPKGPPSVGGTSTPEMKEEHRQEMEDPLGGNFGQPAPAAPAPEAKPAPVAMTEEQEKQKLIDTLAAFIQLHKNDTPVDGQAQCKAILAEKWKVAKIKDLTHQARLEVIAHFESLLNGGK